jgi:hypothetical protein
LGQFFEMCMIVCFGISWPISVLKSLRSKTAKGKSMVFSLFVWVGYVCGITGKIVTGNITYVFIFYIINIVMVTIDILLYFRNVKLDRQREEG